MSQDQTKSSDEISLKETVLKLKEIWGYLLTKWYVILISGLIGGGAGLTYTLLTPLKYISRLTFVVEESKAGVGGLAVLAGQLGFDMGGSSGGVFSGDNVLLFLKSESLSREILLTKYDSVGNILLADKYAEVNKLKTKWKNNKKIHREILFSKYKDGNLPRLEDSLMQIMIKQILEKELSVEKLDKKSSFIEVVVTTRDELLSKYYSERLVKIATDHYVESKIKIKALNVAKLQRRADSLGALLNNRTYSAAATQQTLVDVNPALRTAPVTAEITARDKTMLATIFAEVTKNLEIAKVALSQETPVIQIVDESSLPLKLEKKSKPVFIIGATLVMAIISALFLLFKHFWQEMLNGNP